MEQLTSTQVGKILRKSPATVRRYILVGQIKARKENRTYLIDRSSLNDFITENYRRKEQLKKECVQDYREGATLEYLKKRTQKEIRKQKVLLDGSASELVENAIYDYVMTSLR